MAQCPNCKQKGFLLFLTENGVCLQCKVSIANEITNKFKVIIDTFEELQQSKEIKKIISGTEVILKLAGDLSNYDSYNIVETNFSELAKKAQEEKEVFIINYFQTKLQLTRAKVDDSDNVKENVKHYKSLIIEAINNLIHLDLRRSELEEIISQVKKEQKNFEINSYMDLGKKFELKSDTKKALDAYYEALFIIRKLDENRNEEKMNLEIRIKKLGGKI